MASNTEIKQKILDRIDKLIENAVLEDLERLVSILYNLSNLK